MKVIYNKIALGVATLALSLTVVSCNDALDLAPKGEITKEQLNDNSVESLLSAAYAGLECHFFGNNESFAGPITNWVFDVRSDDAYKGGVVSLWRGIFIS